MTDVLFAQYGLYYDLLYKDKDYDAECAYIAKTLSAAGINKGRLLEFGSGTGKHGRLLGKKGYLVYGVERSAAMVAAAKRATADSTRFDCMQGDIRNVRLAHTFEAVLSLFHVISYQVETADVEKTFLNASEHLAIGGIFFFDVWHGPAVLSERPAVRIKRVEDDASRLVRIAEPSIDTNKNVVKVLYSMLIESKTTSKWSTFSEEHWVRYFFPPEIELFADHAGFTVERTEEFLTGQAPSEQTWGMAYLLRKTRNISR